MASMRSVVLLLAMLAISGAACGGAGSPATTVPATTTTMATPPTATIVPAAPIAPATTTTRATPTVTRATDPREAWVVRGRRYYFPVQPPEVADYGPTHHDYPATDIFAPVGSTLVAVTNGIVDEVSTTDVWDPDVNDPATRGGLYVSIIGADGVRYYYSHLDTVEQGIEAGAVVRAGQRIGTVGISGNARFTSPHVHFGISRPTFAGDWEVRRGQVPPYDFLLAWTAGQDATPDVLP